MNTLTKQHFDEGMDKVRGDIKRLHKDIGGLATMVAKGFEDVTKRFDVRERIDSLEKKMTKVESALNVRL